MNIEYVVRRRHNIGRTEIQITHRRTVDLDQLMCDCLMNFITSIIAAALFLGTIIYFAIKQTETDPLFNYTSSNNTNSTWTFRE